MSTHVTVKFTHAQFDALSRTAGAYGLTREEFIRRTVGAVVAADHRGEKLGPVAYNDPPAYDDWADDSNSWITEAAEMAEWLDSHRALVEAGETTGMTHQDARRRRDMAAAQAVDAGATVDQLACAMRTGTSTAQACVDAGRRHLAGVPR